MRQLAQSLLGKETTASVIKSRNANILSSKTGGSMGGTGVSVGGPIDGPMKQPKIPHNTVNSLGKQKSRNQGVDQARSKMLKSSLGLSKAAGQFSQPQGKNNLMASKTIGNNFTKTTVMANKNKNQYKQSTQPALMFGGTGGQIPSIDLVGGVVNEQAMTFDSYRKSGVGKSSDKKSFISK